MQSAALSSRWAASKKPPLARSRKPQGFAPALLTSGIPRAGIQLPFYCEHRLELRDRQAPFSLWHLRISARTVRSELGTPPYSPVTTVPAQSWSPWSDPLCPCQMQPAVGARGLVETEVLRVRELCLLNSRVPLGQSAPAQSLHCAGPESFVKKKAPWT